MSGVAFGRVGSVSGSNVPTRAPATASRHPIGPARRHGVPVLAALLGSGRSARGRSALVAWGFAVGGSVILGGQPGSQAVQRPPAERLVPPGFRAVAQEAVGRSDRTFWARRRGGVLVSSGGGIVSSYAASGVTVSGWAGTVTLRLVGVGHGDRLTALTEVAPAAEANLVRFRRRGIVEWYRNGPFGLEQGFTLGARPRGSGRPLTLALSIGGSFLARRSGAGIAFVSRAGTLGLRYGGLSVVDASGRRLRAGLALADRRLLVRVWDRGARYPLRIDPFVQDGQKLTGHGEKGASEFGISVALSANGRTALIGGYNDDSLLGALEGLPVHSQALGAAWAFLRTGSGWSQGTKLLPTGERGPGGFGASVALSADGRTALIGGPSGYGGIGAAWVFARSGSTWRQLAKLTPPGLEHPTGYVTNPDGFGASVALSPRGTLAIVGAPEADGGRGSAWIFVRSGSTWRQRGPELAGRGEIGTGQFGASVALSATGEVAAVGGPFDNSGVGAVWVFRGVGSVWRQDGGKLVGHGEAGFGRFGSSVALSAPGTTALVGAPVDANGSGAVWAFSRPASAWSQQGPKLTARGETGAGQFGDRVALSAAGTTALIGAALDDAEVGAAWVFRRHGSRWSQVGAKLTGHGEAGQGEFGVAVALTPAAGTALIGGLGDRTFAGAAWVFEL